MASKRQRSTTTDPDPLTNAAAVHFIKSLTFKPEPIAMATRISTVSDIRLYDLRKQFEVKSSMTKVVHDEKRPPKQSS